jgi:hypothetical protein
MLLNPRKLLDLKLRSQPTERSQAKSQASFGRRSFSFNQFLATRTRPQKALGPLGTEATNMHLATRLRLRSM